MHSGSSASTSAHVGCGAALSDAGDVTGSDAALADLGEADSSFYRGKWFNAGSHGLTGIIGWPAQRPAFLRFLRHGEASQ